jgi:hypothetical protein
VTPLLAHAVQIDYRFPLPVWLYGLAAGLAVALSAPAALAAVRAAAPTAHGDLYPWLRRLRLGALGLALATVLLVVGLVGGFAGPEPFFENPLTILVWVDFWVGLGIVSALVGNVWDVVSPLSAAGRWLERRLAARGASALAYPARLGVWPAVALLLAFSWAELAWDDATEPRTLAVLVVVYLALQLGAMAAFGAEVWLARGELFTVVARSLARFAPLELGVRRAGGPCRADRCVADDRPNCPACWLDAEPADRVVRVRNYGAGLTREPELGPGGGAFVVALLATVVYDGVSQTQRYADVQAWFLRRSDWFGTHDLVLDTLLMGAVVGLFALAFWAVVSVVGRLEGMPGRAAARRYAPTLIPIAAVYFIAHYFLYLVYAGQATPLVVLDPLGRGWGPEYHLWQDAPGAAVWYLQVALIVGGHVAAVFAAHRAALAVGLAPHTALRAQAPLVALMVGYTFAGLWALGQAIESS